MKTITITSPFSRVKETHPDAFAAIVAGIRRIESMVHATELITDVRIVTNAGGNRAFFNPRTGQIIMVASSKCFQPNYRGWKYKTFGGQKDLTPAGVFAHELGHAFDYKMGCSLSLAFSRMFFGRHRLSDEQAVSGYAASDPSEDTAETFRLYVSNPKRLQKCCPERFKLMDNVVVVHGIMRKTWSRGTRT